MNILLIYICLLGLATYLGVTWTIIWYFDEDKEGTFQIAVFWPLVLFFLVFIGIFTLPVWSYYLLFTDRSVKSLFND